MKSANSDDTMSRTQSAQTNPIDIRLSPLLAPSLRIPAHFYFPLSERMYLTKAIAASTSTATMSHQTSPIAIIMPPPIIPPSIIMHFILCFPLKPVRHGIAPDRAIDHSTA